MARVTCNTVDEAIDAMEKMLCPCRETVGPDDGIKWVPDKRVQIQYDGCEWRRVDDQPLQITAVEEEINAVADGPPVPTGWTREMVEDAWFLPRNHEASDLTMESLQKAIAHMERRKLEHPGVKLTINPTHVEIPVPTGWTREMVEDMMYYQNALSEVSSLARGSVEDQPKEESMDDRRPQDGDVVEYEGKLRKVHCACYGPAMWSFFDDCSKYDSKCPDCGVYFGYDPDETVRSAFGFMVPAEDIPAPTESLADVLPDLYGRKEHAAYMARTAAAEAGRKMGVKTAVQLRVRSLMDGLCGKRRGMED